MGVFLDQTTAGEVFHSKTPGAGCSKVGKCYPPDSDFFQRSNDAQKAIKLQLWTWQQPAPVLDSYNLQKTRVNLDLYAFVSDFW